MPNVQLHIYSCKNTQGYMHHMHRAHVAVTKGLCNVYLETSIYIPRCGSLAVGLALDLLDLNMGGCALSLEVVVPTGSWGL
jgi:hypothetical protein